MDENPTKTPAQNAELLAASNQARIEALEAIAPGGAGSLENAFDALRMLVHLEIIGAQLRLTDRIELVFEGRRAEMLDDIERKVHTMQEAREAAQRAQVLASGAPGPRLIRPS